VFPHNHFGKLESHLEWARRERPDARVLIVTESVFSMDGDRAPLRALVGLKRRFGALLLLDEAHAVGVIGANGRGLAAEENLTRAVDIQLGTLGKALGVSGGYICGSHSLIEWLVNRARSFIFSTAPPPGVCGCRDGGGGLPPIGGRRAAQIAALGSHRTTAGSLPEISRRL
jgi:glycine C-acetyltransferase/8-amino-7-oxononanoate synthase